MASTIVRAGNALISIPQMIAALKWARTKVPASDTGICAILTDAYWSGLMDDDEVVYLNCWISKMLTSRGKRCYTMEEWLFFEGHKIDPATYPAKRCVKVRQRWIDWMIADLKETLESPGV